MRYTGFGSGVENRRRFQPCSALRQPAEGLLGGLVDIWHLSFNAGAIKPDMAFYAGLTAHLGSEASELLMVGDTWRDDIVGAVEARSRAR